MEIKKLSNCEVIVFHSVEHEAIPQGMFMVPTFGGQVQQVYDNSNPDMQRIREVYESKGNTMLSRAEELFSEQGLKVKTRLIYDFSPLNYIKKTVKEEDIDLVIIGSKGVHSLAEEIFIGSVSDRVLRNVPCDILVIR